MLFSIQELSDLPKHVLPLIFHFSIFSTYDVYHSLLNLIATWLLLTKQCRLGFKSVSCGLVIKSNYDKILLKRQLQLLTNVTNVKKTLTQTLQSTILTVSFMIFPKIVSPQNQNSFIKNMKRNATNG